MNKENVLKLAEYMKALPDNEYDQRYYSHPTHTPGVDCGSPSCVAGHAAFISGRWKSPMEGSFAIAGDWLGINWIEAKSLFSPKPYGEGDWNPKPQDAAWTLRHLAETGNVVWRHRYEDFAESTD